MLVTRRMRVWHILCMTHMGCWRCDITAFTSMFAKLLVVFTNPNLGFFLPRERSLTQSPDYGCCGVRVWPALAPPSQRKGKEEKKESSCNLLLCSPSLLLWNLSLLQGGDWEKTRGSQNWMFKADQGSLSGRLPPSPCRVWEQVQREWERKYSA